MKRVIKITTVILSVFSVVLCGSLSVFAYDLVPLYSSNQFYNKYESSGTYPNVPDGFRNDISSLNSRPWLSDYTNFDNNEWMVQGGVSKVNLGGFSHSANMLIIRHADTLLWGVQFSKRVNLGFDSSTNSFWFEWSSLYGEPVTGKFFYWSPDSYDSPQVTNFIDEDGEKLLYKFSEDFEIEYCSLDIFNCTVSKNSPVFGSLYRASDVESACDMTFDIPFSLKYKTYTVTAMLDVDNDYLKVGNQYVYEFDKLGLIFRDTPHVMEMNMLASYYDKDFNYVKVDDEDGYFNTIDLYMNPYPSTNDLYRDYNAGEYYDYSFSSAFSYDSKFIDAGVKWIWFRFTICCDSPVLLFPGTLNVFPYSEYAENERYQELSNKISYMIDGDTGTPDIKIDTSSIDNSVKEQEEIIADIYAALDTKTDDLLSSFGYSSMDEFLNDNMNDLNDKNMLASFDFVKMLFENVVSSTGISVLVLFSLTFGFAIYVLGRRLS